MAKETERDEVDGNKGKEREGNRLRRGNWEERKHKQYKMWKYEVRSKKRHGDKARR